MKNKVTIISNSESNSKMSLEELTGAFKRGWVAMGHDSSNGQGTF